MSTRSKYENRRQIFRESAAPLEVVHPMAAVVMFDDFLGKAIDATNDWTVAGVNSGTAAITVAVGGHMRITTGAADNDDVDVASDLIWEAAKACSMEVRIANNDITYLAFNVGFSDAQGEGADLIAMMLAVTTLTSTASDFVGFLYDPDATVDTIRCVAVKNDVDQTVIDTGKVMVNGTFVVLRVDVDALGNAEFYIDGIHVGTLERCVTITDDLCLYVATINHGEGAANTADVDYIKAWQNR